MLRLKMKPDALADYIKRDTNWMKDVGWLKDPVVHEAFKLIRQEFMQKPVPYDITREGAGVVMAGGRHYDAGIYVGIRMLRHVGCKLPVEVWHKGENEWVSDSVRELPGVEVKDLLTQGPPARFRGGYQNKMDSILASKWRQIIFFDADVYPVVDPTYLLYLTGIGGLILWPDLPSTGGALCYESYGIDPRDQIEAVNGGHHVWQFPQAWRVLQLANHFDDYPEYYYQHHKGVGGFGDQDQLRAAIKLLRHPYLMFSRDPGFKPGCFVQSGVDAKPLWVHRCKSKFGPKKYWDDRHCATYRPDLPCEDLVWKFYRKWQKLNPDSVKEKTNY